MEAASTLSTETAWSGEHVECTTTWILDLYSPVSPARHSHLTVPCYKLTHVPSIHVCGLSYTVVPFPFGWERPEMLPTQRRVRMLSHDDIPRFWICYAREVFSIFADDPCSIVSYGFRTLSWDKTRLVFYVDFPAGHLPSDIRRDTILDRVDGTLSCFLSIWDTAGDV